MNSFEIETFAYDHPINVWAVVTHYYGGEGMAVTGWGFGDAEPPEPEEVEFYLSTSEDGDVSEALYHSGVDLEDIQNDLLERIHHERSH